MDSEMAGKLIDLAVAGIDREYPNFPAHVLLSDGDLVSPRRIHPVFYGHFDWHSSVHGHWTLVRLLKLFPGHDKAAGLRSLLEGRFEEKALVEEARYLRANPGFERMYGWAWALRLCVELRSWDDEQGREWADRLSPLEEIIVANTRTYLPKLSRPIRCGFHPESSFPLGQMIDYAREVGNLAFKDELLQHSRRFYEQDRSYPVSYEPSGHDFFSAGLNEADLMRRVLGDRFESWLSDFFPDWAKGELCSLSEPVVPADFFDGHLVHLVGLNLNRAWTMRSIAHALPDHDERKERLLECSRRHESEGMKGVFTGGYEGEHWLGSFAVYLLTGVGL